MTRLLALLLLLPVALQAAGLGVYNPAQHAVNGFMPTQLPDLQLWLDANKIGLTNGASVDVWQDFSGKSNWATNGTASKRPVVGTINGRQALVMDGVDDWLSIFDLKMQTYVSIFCVVHMTSSTTKNFIMEQGVNAGANPGFLFYGEDFPWAFFRTNAHYVGGSKWGTNIPIVAALHYDGNGKYLRNGIELQSTSTNGTARANTLLTQTFWIGARSAAERFSDGRYSEILIYTNMLQSSQRLQVERYLGTKYGIVVQ